MLPKQSAACGSSAKSGAAMIFAAKTTLSALLALLVAFTFDLDQPQWALLTVFIVAQPQSGMVLAKSFYRIIGTFIGAAVALLLVSLFAQERVLFLGALALWIGICTFGSQYARNFAAYSFVLSGYTVAMVGIPGALDAGNAFYIATARVTEISLGIIATATVSHIILPNSLAAVLWQAIADVRVRVADYALAVLGDGDMAAARGTLIGRAIAIENLRASAFFEDREVRDRSNLLRLLNTSLVNVIAEAQLLGERPENLRRASERIDTETEGAHAAASAALRDWRRGDIGAAELRARLQANTPSVSPLCEFLDAVTAYADAHEACVSGEGRAPRRVSFMRANDAPVAFWTGLRAALAIVAVGSFWILADWPHGSTALILAAVATARLATMGHATPIAIAASLIFGLSTIPAFVVIEMLLPHASGFEMFALIVGPVIFCCALLMANKRPEVQLIGFLSGLLFASVGLFQNRMIYDPVNLLNTSIAAVFAAATALVLWSILAPETPEAALRRFRRVARQALANITARRSRIGLPEFETSMIEALDQLRSRIRPDRPNEVTAFETGIALLGTGRALIRLREEGTGEAAGAPGALGLAGEPEARLLECRYRQLSAEHQLGALRDAA